MSDIRLSVRALVEFTLHGEDITTGGSLRDMLEGSLGHRARQALLGEGWQAEAPLSLRLPFPEDGFTLLLSGRMDALLPGDPPLIEEIKLWQDSQPPAAALPAHRAQAVVYGHLLCLRDSLPAVEVRVSYVSREGELHACFSEQLSAEACAEAFDGLLQPWLRRTRLMLRE